MAELDITNQLIKKIDKLITIIEFKCTELFSAPTDYTRTLTKAPCRNGMRCIYHIRRGCWFDHLRYSEYDRPAQSKNKVPTAAHLSSAPLQESMTNLSSLAEQEPPSRLPEFYCSIADEDSSTTLRRDDARVGFRVRPRVTHVLPAEADCPTVSNYQPSPATHF